MKLGEAFTLLTESRSQMIDSDDVIDYIKHNCKDFVRNYLDNKAVDVYRGLKSYNDPLIVKPSESERRSRNTSNYYTYFIDHSKNWSQFPKRSRSIICTTFMEQAHSFGNVFLVIPTDGAKFGICNSYDFWFSFPFCFDKLDITSMNRFNNLFDMSAEVINSFLRSKIRINDDNSSIQKIEKNFDKIISRGIKPSDSSFRSKMRDAGGMIDKSLEKMLWIFFNQGGIQAGMDYLLDPEKNKIKLKNYPIRKGSVAAGSRGSEVWTDADCIMYPVDKVDELYEELDEY